MPIGYQKALFKKMHDQCVYQKTIFIIFPFVQETKFLIENNENGSSGFDIKPQYSWGNAGMALLGMGAGIFIMLALMLSEYELLPIGLVFTALLVWCIIERKKSNKKEKFVREQFYQTMGCCIMPEWLMQLRTYRNRFQSF